MDRPKLGLARRMRKAPVSTEALLWKLLRDRRLADLKFRRQVPIGRYIADFVCLGHRLIFEADGPWHENSEHDRQRDAWLAGQGFRVLRFKNEVIHGQREVVLAAILAMSEAPLLADDDELLRGR
jgi:very-short-patch-repair endonuclease